MHKSTIYVNPTLPDEIGFAQAAGVPGDVRFYFKTPSGLPYAEIADLNPQLVMRPFTTSGIYGYDITVNDVTGASGIAAIPASVMNDRFNIEVYTRNDQLQPQDMLACGRRAPGSSLRAMKLELFSAMRFRDALAGHGMHVLDDDVLDPQVGEGFGKSHAVDHVAGSADVIDEQRGSVAEDSNGGADGAGVNGGEDHGAHIRKDIANR